MPGLIPGAVDEVLRYDPSVVVWRRQTKQEVVIGDVVVSAGARIFLWLAATGRDASSPPVPLHGRVAPQPRRRRRPI